MADENSIIAAFPARIRSVVFRWWGGIGCRVSFYMTMALVCVVVFVGAVFFQEGEKALDAEIRSRAFTMAGQLAALSAEDIIAENRRELSKKASSFFAVNEDSRSGTTLLYLMIYNRSCVMLINSASFTKAYSGGDSLSYAVPSGNSPELDEAMLGCDPRQTASPIFTIKRNSVHELMLPVLAGKEGVGFIRIGLSSHRYEEQFWEIMMKSAAALLGILLVGIAFSQVIAVSITRPIVQLSEAAEKLTRQNWEAPIPIRGSDELSRLAHTFNRMALTLKNREASLSQRNRDLFLLHTAGLDLMESLEVKTLMLKISERAEDLVRADTIAISAVDSSDRMLKYLGVFGRKSSAIQGREVPLEAGGVYNWLASYGTPLLIPEAQTDFRLDNELMRTIGIKSMMAVPLWSSNTMTGILTAIDKKGGSSFDKNDLRLLTVLSSLAAAALQNTSLYRDLNRNMEELKAAQKQLVHSAKMAAIGELSANVAHEINNPLTSVLGYTTHLMKTLDIPESQRRILGLMEQETLRVRKIIRNLLDFARQRPIVMQPGDIAQPLRETVALVQGTADKSSIVIHAAYPADPVLVNMDHNEMKQVFINILNNALQAMPGGGELSLRLKASGDHELMIEVADTGPGIAPEHLDKIFEPFFSTKDTGDGTGLGLSISYQIVRNHGGKIEAESECGKGAVFRVFLPRYDQSATA